MLEGFKKIGSDVEKVIMKMSHEIEMRQVMMELMELKRLRGKGLFMDAWGLEHNLSYIIYLFNN